jgi:hypothetical protein
VPNVAQEVCEVFEMTEMIIDGDFTLKEVVEPLEGIDGEVISIVEEEATDRATNDIGRRLRNLDHLHEAWVDRRVQSEDGTPVDL